MKKIQLGNHKTIHMHTSNTAFSSQSLAKTSATRQYVQTYGKIQTMQMKMEVVRWEKEEEEKKKTDGCVRSIDRITSAPTR